jgi:hypothetical protein
VQFEVTGVLLLLMQFRKKRTQYAAVWCNNSMAPSVHFLLQTSVKIGSGSLTSFWFDAWLEGLPLAQRFPSLFSHVTRPKYSVKSVCSYSPLNLALRPLLSHAAQSELHNLHTLLANFVLDENVPDMRVLRINSRPITTKSAYLAAFDHL